MHTVLLPSDIQGCGFFFPVRHALSSVYLLLQHLFLFLFLFLFLHVCTRHWGPARARRGLGTADWGLRTVDCGGGGA